MCVCVCVCVCVHACVYMNVCVYVFWYEFIEFNVYDAYKLIQTSHILYSSFCLSVCVYCNSFKCVLNLSKVIFSLCVCVCVCLCVYVCVCVCVCVGGACFSYQNSSQYNALLWIWFSLVSAYR